MNKFRATAAGQRYYKEKLQSYFTTNFDELRDLDEDEIPFISQNHFGDLLIEEEESDGDRFQLWRNLNTNGGGIEVTYYGIFSDFNWESIYLEGSDDESIDE